LLNPISGVTSGDATSQPGTEAAERNQGRIRVETLAGMIGPTRSQAHDQEQRAAKAAAGQGHRLALPRNSGHARRRYKIIDHKVRTVATIVSPNPIV
jgi:hypothetical protein